MHKTALSSAKRIVESLENDAIAVRIAEMATFLPDEGVPKETHRNKVPWLAQAETSEVVGMMCTVRKRCPFCLLFV